MSISSYILNLLGKSTLFSISLSSFLTFISMVFFNPHKIYTVIHEFGHKTCLMLSAKLLNITITEKFNTEYKRAEYKPFKRVNLIIKTRLYNGKTNHSLYQYLAENKHYNLIRLNALSGSLFEMLYLFIRTSILILICHTNRVLITIILSNTFSILTIILLAFFCSDHKEKSDFYIFLHPNKFHYKYNKKVGDK